MPVPSAVLPALVRDRPKRTSSSERLESVRVTPSANCWLSTSTKALDGLLVSPGIGGGSKLLTLRWLKRTKPLVPLPNCWSTLTSTLSLSSVRSGRLSKLFETPARVGAGRPSSTLRANGVIADAGITPSA